MRSVVRHIEKIREQPHNVRKQIAYTYAGIGTGIIAIVWLGASLATGAFLIRDSSLTREASDSGVTAGASQMAGAAAALPSAAAPSVITIVDAASTTDAKQPERTIIPF